MEVQDSMQKTEAVIFGQKLSWSLISALLFIIVSPQFYTLFSKGQTDAAPDSNCQTAQGRFTSAGLFFILNYFVMKIAIGYSQSRSSYDGSSPKSQMSDFLIIKYSLYTTMLYFVVSSNELYEMSGKLISGLSNQKGCPHMQGVLVHAVVFLVLLVLMMYLPKDI